MRQPNNWRNTPLQPNESPTRQHPEDAPQNRMRTDESIMRLTRESQAVRKQYATNPLWRARCMMHQLTIHS